MQAYKLRGKIDATGNFKDFEDAIQYSTAVIRTYARVPRNRVFTKILRDSAETPKNPVSLTATSAQKPGFCENIRCDSQIR
jgi:hypothetical protein